MFGYQAAVIGVLGAVVASEKLQEGVRKRMIVDETKNSLDDENHTDNLSYPTHGSDFPDERMEIMDYWPLSGPSVMKIVQVTIEDGKVTIGKNAIKS